jgi:hypothetical protein
MNGPQFFETRMGQQFYDGTMRRIADALQEIAVQLQSPASRRGLGLPVPVSLDLLDEIVNLVRHVADDQRSAHVEESALATALLARIEKETTR